MGASNPGLDSVDRGLRCAPRRGPEDGQIVEGAADWARAGDSGPWRHDTVRPRRLGGHRGGEGAADAVGPHFEISAASRSGATVALRAAARVWYTCADRVVPGCRITQHDKNFRWRHARLDGDVGCTRGPPQTARPCAARTDAAQWGHAVCCEHRPQHSPLRICSRPRGSHHCRPIT
jgi:hypothetical protein